MRAAVLLSTSTGVQVGSRSPKWIDGDRFNSARSKTNLKFSCARRRQRPAVDSRQVADVSDRWLRRRAPTSTVETCVVYTSQIIQHFGFRHGTLEPLILNI
jgi:hypothetical protein